MPNCHDIELLLHDYLEGYLLPSQREVLEEHVRGCEDCRILLAEMRELDDEFIELPDVEAPDGLNDRILSSLPPDRYRARAFSLGRGAGAALAALLVLAMGFLVSVRHDLGRGDGLRDVEIVFSAPGAASVAVVGDFNEWHTSRDFMARSSGDGLWRIKLKLRPGIYEYGFLIDGSSWKRDPLSENSVADGFGGENSVLFVGG